MSLPSFEDTFLHKNPLADLDVMAMEVYIDQKTEAEILQDFPLQEIHLLPSDFDFLDNFHEPSAETPANPPVEAEFTNSPEESDKSPVYVNILIKDEEEEPPKVSAAPQEVILEVETAQKYVLVKPPLKLVDKEPPKEDEEVKLIKNEFEKLIKGEITIPMSSSNTKKPRERKQKLKIKMIEYEVQETPRKRIFNLSRARKRLFPVDIVQDEDKENLEVTPEKVKETFEASPEKVTKKRGRKPLGKKSEVSFESPQIQETLVTTRRSLRINSSVNQKCNKEVYFTCDICQRIYKTQKMLLVHRKSHYKTPPQ